MAELELFHGLCFNYVKAVDKNDKIAISRLNKSRHLDPIPGAKACYLSHYDVYKSIVENGYDKTLILEDDIDMELEIFDIMPGIHRNLPNDWELLFLGHCHERMGKTTILDNELSNKTNKLHTAEHPQCTHAYAVTASAAKKLLEILDIDHINTDLAIDMELARLIQNKKLIAYGVHPQIIAQWKGDKPDTIPNFQDDTYYLKNSTLEFLGFKRHV
ncbi:19647_t:CDS:1 [Cetraspora pellucida]|uniref:19647_t:CDS:1 n=1 Tax=Cetraspora pellucida TaxID=1433469 RepID=A0A9N8WHT2_9GLOM|nr:19647_t:CDS:1 [Cetraspora pellucida]